MMVAQQCEQCAFNVPELYTYKSLEWSKNTWVCEREKKQVREYTYIFLSKNHT